MTGVFHGFSQFLQENVGLFCNTDHTTSFPARIHIYTVQVAIITVPPIDSDLTFLFLPYWAVM